MFLRQEITNPPMVFLSYSAIDHARAVDFHRIPADLDQSDLGWQAVKIQGKSRLLHLPAEDFF